MAAKLKRTYSSLSNDYIFIDGKRRRIEPETEKILVDIRNKNFPPLIRRKKSKPECENVAPKNAAPNFENWWDVVLAQEKQMKKPTRLTRSTSKQLKQAEKPSLKTITPTTNLQIVPIHTTRSVTKRRAGLMDEDDSSPSKRLCSTSTKTDDLTPDDTVECVAKKATECSQALKPVEAMNTNSSLAATISGSNSIEQELSEFVTSPQLPTISRENIAQLREWFVLEKPSSFYEAKQIITEIKSSDYLEQLAELYEDCQQNDANHMSHLREIFWSLIEITETSQDAEFFKELFGLRMIHVLIDCYKNHPKSPGVNDTDDFVKKSKLYRPIPMPNTLLEDLMRHNYWLKYLEYLFPVDAGVSLHNIQTIANETMLKIFDNIVEESEFLDQIFNVLNDDKSEARKKFEIIAFLRQFTINIRGLEKSYQSLWEQTLSTSEVLESVDEIMTKSKSKTLKLEAGKFLQLLMDSYPEMVRAFFMDDFCMNFGVSSSFLINRILENFTSVSSPNDEMADILQELLKLLLDSRMIKLNDDMEFAPFIIKSLIYAIEMNKHNVGMVDRLVMILETLLSAFPAYYPVIYRQVVINSFLQELMILMNLYPVLAVSVLDFVKKLTCEMDDELADILLKDDCICAVNKLYRNGNSSKNLIGSKVIALINDLRSFNNNILNCEINRYFSDSFMMPKYIRTIPPGDEKFEKGTMTDD